MPAYRGIARGLLARGQEERQEERLGLAKKQVGMAETRQTQQLGLMKQRAEREATEFKWREKEQEARSGMPQLVHDAIMGMPKEQNLSNINETASALQVGDYELGPDLSLTITSPGGKMAKIPREQVDLILQRYYGFSIPKKAGAGTLSVTNVRQIYDSANSQYQAAIKTLEGYLGTTSEEEQDPNVLDRMQGEVARTQERRNYYGDVLDQKAAFRPTTPRAVAPKGTARDRVIDRLIRKNLEKKGYVKTQRWKHEPKAFHDRWKRIKALMPGASDADIEKRIKAVQEGRQPATKRAKAPAAGATKSRQLPAWF